MYLTTNMEMGIAVAICTRIDSDAISILLN